MALGALEQARRSPVHGALSPVAKRAVSEAAQGDPLEGEPDVFVAQSSQRRGELLLSIWLQGRGKTQGFKQEEHSRRQAARKALQN